MQKRAVAYRGPRMSCETATVAPSRARKNFLRLLDLATNRDTGTSTLVSVARKTVSE